MERGFNSDIKCRGQSYHVQTEDWGPSNPYLVSRVFLNGAVLKTVKRSYAEVLNPLALKSEIAIRTALQRQHNEIVDLVMGGRVP